MMSHRYTTQNASSVSFTTDCLTSNLYRPSGCHTCTDYFMCPDTKMYEVEGQDTTSHSAGGLEDNVWTLDESINIFLEHQTFIAHGVYSCVMAKCIPHPGRTNRFAAALSAEQGPRRYSGVCMHWRATASASLSATPLPHALVPLPNPLGMGYRCRWPRCRLLGCRCLCLPSRGLRSCWPHCCCPSELPRGLCLLRLPVPPTALLLL
jgi:hypothetical protein